MTAATAAALPGSLVELLEGRALCYLATTMPNGSPQLTLTWVDTDGVNILINTVMTHQKVRNVTRDPRVAVAISDPANPMFYFQVRGVVSSMSTEGAAENIEELSLKYSGKPYPWYGGREQQRVVLTIAPERVSTPR